MLKASPRQSLTLSLVALALTLLMLGLQLGAMLRLRGSQHAAYHAFGMKAHVGHTLRLLVDAESGQRGFLLTGQDVFLEPYNRALRDLPQELEALHALVELPEQKARVEKLEGLATAKIDELRETVALQKEGRLDSALAVVRSGRGRRLLADIREVDTAMRDAADARLARQYARAARLARDSFIASAVAAALIFGDAALLIVLARDARRRQEQRIVDLQSFAGRVAHDIRSPLVTVSLSLDFAKRRLGDDKASAVLDRATSTLRRVSTLVDDLFSFAKAGGPPAEGANADVGSVIRDVVAAAQVDARERGIALEVEGASPAKVACSPGVLTSMLSNLVDNAIKHIGDAPTRRVTVRGTSGRRATCIEVRDTGQGVPRELWATIFDPYVRAPGSKAQGLGLGLATVRRLAQAHGGSAGIAKNVPSGTVFWIEVPNVPEAGRRHAPWAWHFGRRVHS